MADEIRRRRGLNYLGELGAKLRDLRGTATLAHELIQNAEDAIKDILIPSEQEATLVFHVTQDALIVDNGGVFSDCEEQDKPVCPWKAAGKRPCDFHSFAEVGGAAKRRASNERNGNSGLKGAFGFGFTAVYQVTDHPHVISNGRHWILEDDKPEQDRILECNRPDCKYCHQPSLPGTRFVLPWAYDATSAIRFGLNALPVSKDKPLELVSDLEAALPQTVLFLDHIRELRVNWQGRQKMNVKVGERPSSVISVTANGESSKWALLTHDFAVEAEKLRARHPAGEKRPSSLVKIAVPQSSASNGFFFAYLPTQTPTGVPFHVNGDFFPSNDRKRLLLEDDYQGEWNRAAIRAGALALDRGLLDLRSHLGPKHFWGMLQKVKAASKPDSLLGRAYWDQIRPQLSVAKVVPACDGEWYSASSVRLITEDEASRFSELHSQLDILTVHPDLSDERTLLMSIDVGVISLDSATLASSLLKNGITGEKSLSDFPEYFQSEENWGLLWQQIQEVLMLEASLTNASRPSSSKSFFSDSSIVKCTDGLFRPLRSTFQTDPDTSTLFSSLDPQLHFACDDQDMHDALGNLIKIFTVSDAVECVANVLLLDLVATCAEEETSSSFTSATIDKLLGWFNSRVDELRSNHQRVSRFRALCICPTSDGTQSFEKVVLPGGFTDPIGITSVADQNALKPYGPLVELLQLDSLSLEQYVLEWLPDAFDEYEIDVPLCHELLSMLSTHQGELYSSESSQQIRDTLRSLECIPCADGKAHAIEEDLFFHTDLVSSVLASSVTYVDDSMNSKGIQNLLEWLGVESEPRLDRVVSHLFATTQQAKTPTQESITSVVRLIEHLGGRVDELKSETALLERLKANAWLPTVKRTWEPDSQKWVITDNQWSVPKDVYVHNHRDLVWAVGRFARLSSQLEDKIRLFLSLVGVVDRPKAATVVKHLRIVSKQASPISHRVYNFLNKALDDGEIYSIDLTDLKAVKCLFNDETQTAVRPRDCFSKENPFGSRRVLLSSQVLSTLTHLLSAFSIRPCPSWIDAIDVISEIAKSDDVLHKRKISNEDRQALRASWRLIEAALRDDDISSDEVLRQLTALSELQVVCRKDNLLEKPQRVFFRDREYLAEAFSSSLDAELIPMQQGTTEALTKAGVRKLSEVTRVRVIHLESEQGEAIEVMRRIRERADLLTSVLETPRLSRGKTAVADFSRLQVIESSELLVELTFCGFERPLPPVQQRVFAVLDQAENTLRYCLDDGCIPWDAIACELARMFLGSDDVTQLSAAISSAIEPDSQRKAQRKLSQLGFPTIELHEDFPSTVNSSQAFTFGKGTMGNEDHPTEQTPTSLQVVQNMDSSQSIESEILIPSDTRIQRPGFEIPRVATISPQNPTATPQANRNDTSAKQWTSPPRKEEVRESVRRSQPPAFVYTGANDSKSDVRVIDWLATQPGTTDRRQARIQELSSQAVRRSSTQVIRNQRVNRISKEEVFHYLRGLYSYEDVLMCQMRPEGDSDLHQMPFRKKDTELYWGREELFNRELAQQLPYDLPEDVRLFLFLCPTCASIYTEFIGTQPHEQQRLLNWITSDADETTFDVRCSLSGRQPNRTIHFHPKHLDDIRSVDGIFGQSNEDALNQKGLLTQETGRSPNNG
jgi:hypothetical protein